MVAALTFSGSSYPCSTSFSQPFQFGSVGVIMSRLAVVRWTRVLHNIKQDIQLINFCCIAKLSIYHAAESHRIWI